MHWSAVPRFTRMGEENKLSVGKVAPNGKKSGEFGLTARSVFSKTSPKLSSSCFAADAQAFACPANTAASGQAGSQPSFRSCQAEYRAQQSFAWRWLIREVGEIE